MPQRRRRRERTLEEFLSWLLGPSSQRAADSAGDARALRKRIAWCWRIRPRIAPPDARRHTVMADGTYMGHGWCLIIAIDGQTGEVLGWQWCAVFCQIFVGRFGVSFSPFERLFLGRFGFGQSCGLSVIA